MALTAIIEARDEKEEKFLNQLIKATNKNDPKQSDIDALKKVFDEVPGVWQSAGDMAIQAQIMIINRHFSNSYFTREAVHRKLRDMRDNLGWNEASEIEKLLIRQVCLCWLNVHITEIRNHETTRGNHSMREGLYWEKALLAAQKRYLRAVESLGRMQKIVAQTKKIQARADDAKANLGLKAAKLLGNLNFDETLHNAD